jgi:hypothetical protein
MSSKPPSNLYPQGRRDLRVYQLARQLANLVYDATSYFPIRSLQEKKLDGSWDRTYKVVKEDQESYDF